PVEKSCRKSRRLAAPDAPVERGGQQALDDAKDDFTFNSSIIATSDIARAEPSTAYQRGEAATKAGFDAKPQRRKGSQRIEEERY
ncbi:MAG: hypothetical protein WD069_21995, partial [Planctomycetales bacterium]